MKREMMTEEVKFWDINDDCGYVYEYVHGYYYGDNDDNYDDDMLVSADILFSFLLSKRRFILINILLCYLKVSAQIRDNLVLLVNYGILGADRSLLTPFLLLASPALLICSVII
jgi:hypothetical protein